MPDKLKKPKYLYYKLEKDSMSEVIKERHCPNCGAIMDYNTDWREENETYH